MLTLSFLSIALALVNIFRVLFSVKQYDFKIAVRYTQYGADSFILGDWYSLYDMAIFAFVTTVIALLLSMKLHPLHKPVAIGILVLQLILMIMLFIIGHAILSRPPVAS